MRGLWTTINPDWDVPTLPVLAQISAEILMQKRAHWSEKTYTVLDYGHNLAQFGS